VAEGAAIHAAILEAQNRGDESELAEVLRRRLQAVRQENVNSHGLGVVAADPKSGKEINHVMIPHNTRLPVEKKQVFTTRRDGQHRVSVQVLEGDAPDPLACSLLGKCRIKGLPPDLPKGSLIEVTYSFDAAGRITVKARDKTGGNEAAIEIERRGGLTEEQVDAYTNLAHEYHVE
jgi:molecular chaperone DnaK